MSTNDRRALLARRAGLAVAQAALGLAHQRIERDIEGARTRFRDVLDTQNRLDAALAELPCFSLEWWRAKAELERCVAEIPGLAQMVGALMSADAQNHIARERCANELAAIDAALGPLTPADADRARAEAN